MKKIILALVFILSAGMAMAGEKTSGEAELIKTLVNAKPQNKKDLEAITGPLDLKDQAGNYIVNTAGVTPGSTTISINYSNDVFHGKLPKPGQSVPADAVIGNYVVYIKDKMIDEVIPDYTATDSAEDFILPTGVVKQVGDFYFSEKDAGVQIEWNRERPKYLSQISPLEEQKLIDAFKTVWKAGFTIEAIEENFAILEVSKSGVNGEKSASSRSWKLVANSDPAAQILFAWNIDATLPAAEIIALFNLKDPVIRSTDVHMSNRILVDAQDNKYPKFKDYNVIVSFADENLVEAKDKGKLAQRTFKLDNARIKSIIVQK